MGAACCTQVQDHANLVAAIDVKSEFLQRYLNAEFAENFADNFVESCRNEPSPRSKKGWGGLVPSAGCRDMASWDEPLACRDSGRPAPDCNVVNSATASEAMDDYTDPWVETLVRRDSQETLMYRDSQKSALNVEAVTPASPSKPKHQDPKRTSDFNEAHQYADDCTFGIDAITTAAKVIQPMVRSRALMSSDEVPLPIAHEIRSAGHGKGRDKGKDRGKPADQGKGICDDSRKPQLPLSEACDSAPRQLDAPLDGTSKGSKGKGKVSGKCRGPPPVPKGARGKGGRKGISPAKLRWGRRFHWDGLTAEQARGTLFDTAADPDAGLPPHLDTTMLRALFADVEEEEDAEEFLARTLLKRTSCSSNTRLRRSSVGKPREGSDEKRAIVVFNDARAQHIAIVMRRIFGHDVSMQDVERLASAVARLELPQEMAQALLDHDGELLELLCSIVPSPDEATALLAAAAQPKEAGALRMAEQRCLPFARLPQAKACFRALRLGAQAGWMQQGVMDRITIFAAAGAALRESVALHQLLCLVARLCSWINTTEPGVEVGFTLSSTLGKLRQFRALRGDRDISLLHIVVLASVHGKFLEAADFGRRLGNELKAVAVAAKEDVRQLYASVVGFRSEADWLLSEPQLASAADAGSLVATDAGSTVPEVRERLQEIYRLEVGWRAEELEKAWVSACGEWESVVDYFGERSEQTGLEQLAEKLLFSISKFLKEVQDVACEISSQPERFASIFPAIPEGLAIETASVKSLQDVAKASSGDGQLDGADHTAIPAQLAGSAAAKRVASIFPASPERFAIDTDTEASVKSLQEAVTASSEDGQPGGADCIVVPARLAGSAAARRIASVFPASPGRCAIDREASVKSLPEPATASSGDGQLDVADGTVDSTRLADSAAARWVRPGGQCNPPGAPPVSSTSQ